MYSRYGHVNQVFVKAGDNVKKGQKIATNGTGNGQWAAHLHRDHPTKFPLLSGGAPSYTFYNIGWTRENTKEFFVDPHKYPKGLGDGYDHAGYDWLEKANYGTEANPKWCWHPGLDENGKGSGNADYDDPVYAVSDGIVRYAYTGSGTNGGWGHLIVIEEFKPEPEVVGIEEEISTKDTGIATAIPVMGETTTTAVPVYNTPGTHLNEPGEALAPEGGNSTPPPEIAVSVAPKEITLKEAVLSLLKYIFGRGWKK